MKKKFIFVKILKKKGVSFKPQDFIQDPSSIMIPDMIQKAVMTENRSEQARYLKSTKDAIKGTVLAKYVTVIPPAFEKIIKKLIREAK